MNVLQRFINRATTSVSSRRVAMFLMIGKFLTCGCLFFIVGPCLWLTAIYIFLMAIAPAFVPR